MRKDPKIFLEDMIYSIGVIYNETDGLRFEDFKTDVKTQDAVIRRFAVIGEAANNLPKDLKESHEEIEWRKIIDMRNFLLHEYFDIDLRLVWDTVKGDLPKLKERLTKIYKELK